MVVSEESSKKRKYPYNTVGYEALLENPKINKCKASLHFSNFYDRNFTTIFYFKNKKLIVYYAFFLSAIVDDIVKSLKQPILSF